jgi:3-oxoacyl-[acyl-carrier protein] reductase
MITQIILMLSSLSVKNNEFKNKIILITGASHGIGKGIAQRLGKKGAIVIVNYLKSKKAANEVVREINQQEKGLAIAIKSDVSKISSVVKMTKQIIKKFNRIDVLINNAGIVYEPADWVNISPKNWDKTIATDLTGVFNCIKTIAPIMLKQKKGNILNISSTLGFFGNTYAPAYTVSKSGVINLTQGFAKELAPYINVNSVAPGWTNTRWHKYKEAKYHQKTIEDTLLKREGQISDVVNTVEFLISEKSSFITGQTLIVDGGATLVK